MLRAERAASPPKTETLDKSVAIEAALAKIEPLLSGRLRLPFPHICSLPQAVVCQNGCGALYCSSRCCAEAWMHGHCLLCPLRPSAEHSMLLEALPPDCPYLRPLDPRSLTKFDHDRKVFGWLEAPLAAHGSATLDDPAVTARSASKGTAPPISQLSISGVSACSHAQPSTFASPSEPPSFPPLDAISTPSTSAGLGSTAGGTNTQNFNAPKPNVNVNAPTRRTPLPKPPWITTQCSPDACQQILEYSARLEMPTVVLAAQVVASVLCTAQQSAWILRRGSAVGCAMVMATGAAALAHARDALEPLGGAEAVDDDVLFAACLKGAWLPMRAAAKKPLIHCTFPPAGVAVGDYEKHVDVVVENCVRLYRGSMHDTRVGELLTAEVVSNMLGAFELNCVGITVESPVEDLSDEVRSAQRRAEGGGNGTQKQILDETKALLVSLGSTDLPCDGSAFYALQSCVNHSNTPNCSCQKDVDDRDGAAVLTALTTIAPGHELTISYVGDVSQYSPAELAATLAEYGIPPPANEPTS